MRSVPAVLAGLATLLSVVSCSSSSAHSESSEVQVSVTSCGSGWTNARAGDQTVVVHNTDSRAGEAQLINPRTGAVFADVEPLGPGTSDTVRVSLSAGPYAWRCLMEDESAITGSTVQITGLAHGTTPGVRPVSQADLIAATQAYQRYVSAQLPHLAVLTDRIGADIAANQMTRARQDWLPAHLDYERLGAAYGAFGDLDGAINGLPNGLPGGIHDVKWTGFHRVEYGLWHHEARATLLPYVHLLTANVRGLKASLAQNDIDPLEISIRAHEISENALQFELTGRTDYGSHSQLATVGANLQGTAIVLRIIHSLIAPRYAALPRVLTQLALTQRDVASSSRTRLDADLSQLCELLAPIAAILEPRRTS